MWVNCWQSYGTFVKNIHFATCVYPIDVRSNLSAFIFENMKVLALNQVL